MNPSLLLIIQAVLDIIAKHWPPNTPLVLTKEQVAVDLANQITIGDAHLAAAFAELGIPVPE